MKIERTGIKEILRKIWLFPENKIKSSESFIKQPTQLIVELNSSLQQIIVTQILIQAKKEKVKDYRILLSCTQVNSSS